MILEYIFQCCYPIVGKKKKNTQNCVRASPLVFYRVNHVKRDISRSFVCSLGAFFRTEL